MPFIYCLRNVVNGKVYVGYSCNPERRWEREREGALRPKDRQYDTLLSRAIRKYGWDSFLKELLEACEDQVAGLEAEKKWVQLLQSDNPTFGYNMDAGGGMPPNHTGKTRSIETRKKMGAGHKGKVVSEATRKKLSDRNKGKKLSAEAKRHLSEVNKGKSFSENTRTKMSQAKKGVPLSEAHRKALSKSKKLLAAGGLTPPNKGVSGVVKHSTETKAKLSAAHKGKRHSPEHRANIGAALRAVWAKKRSS